MKFPAIGRCIQLLYHLGGTGRFNQQFKLTPAQPADRANHHRAPDFLRGAAAHPLKAVEVDNRLHIKLHAYRAHHFLTVFALEAFLNQFFQLVVKITLENSLHIEKINLRRRFPGKQMHHIIIWRSLQGGEKAFERVDRRQRIEIQLGMLVKKRRHCK